MKIALPVDGNSLESQVCISFGRAPYYLVRDTETKTDNFITNTAATQSGGAGIRAAQIVADQEVNVLLTPRCGVNAAEVIQAAGIEIYKTEGDSIEGNIEAFLDGRLSALDEIHEGLHGS